MVIWKVVIVGTASMSLAENYTVQVPADYALTLSSKVFSNYTDKSDSAVTEYSSVCPSLSRNTCDKSTELFS